MNDLKLIYKAPTKKAAEDALMELEKKWEKSISNWAERLDGKVR